jgi:hypothetical protein
VGGGHESSLPPNGKGIEEERESTHQHRARLGRTRRGRPGAERDPIAERETHPTLDGRPCEIYCPRMPTETMPWAFVTGIFWMT